MVSKAFRLASFLRSKVNELEKVLSADLLPLHKNIEIEYEGAKLITKSSSNSAGGSPRPNQFQWAQKIANFGGVLGRSGRRQESRVNGLASGEPHAPSGVSAVIRRREEGNGISKDVRDLRHSRGVRTDFTFNLALGLCG
jgi:hypothetical protein